MKTNRKMPEGLKKKRERDQRLAKEAEKACQEQEKKKSENQKYYLEKGKQYWEAYETDEKALVDKKRQCKDNSSFYVEEEPKFFLVIRIKGIRKVAPTPKKIMRLFRLRQIGNAVFLRNNKATMNMLRRIEPWVTYGKPNRKTIKGLIYKRGFGKIKGDRIPLTCNEIVEKGLGDIDVRCIEDLINEIYNFGENFKKANNFLWPFKLNAPRGGFKKKRQPYLNGGSHGPRFEFINNLAQRML